MLMVKRTVVAISVVVLGIALVWLYIESDPNRPTPSQLADVPHFIGSPAIPKPMQVALALAYDQHPYLAKSGVNSMHNDSAQSDSYRWAGPLGNNLEVSSKQFHRILGSCVSQTFDRKGRMIGTCVTPFGVTLVARDPKTLAVLARQSITHWLPIGQKFSGGVYFHLDHEDHVLLATNGLDIQRWQLAGEGNKLEWQLAQSISIAETLDNVVKEKHRVIDVMPDWQGNYWFITRAGLIGAVAQPIDRGTRDIVVGELPPDREPVGDVVVHDINWFDDRELFVEKWVPVAVVRIVVIAEPKGC